PPHFLGERLSVVLAHPGLSVEADVEAVSLKLARQIRYPARIVDLAIDQDVHRRAQPKRPLDVAESAGRPRLAGIQVVAQHDVEAAVVDWRTLNMVDQRSERALPAV